MNRTVLIIILVLALASLAFNLFMVDYDNPFAGDSFVSCVGVLASLCAIVLLLIYMTSKRIEAKLKEK